MSYIQNITQEYIDISSEQRQWILKAIPYLKAFKEELEEAITLNFDMCASMPEQTALFEVGRKEMQDQVQELKELLEVKNE